MNSRRLTRYAPLRRRSSLQLLERKDLLTGDLPLADPPVVLFEYAVVSEPTVAESTQTDRTSELPHSLRTTHEWDRFSLEVWVSTSGDQPVDVQDLTLDLNYRTDITSAVEVEFGQSFEGEQSFSLHDATGEVRQIFGSTAGLELNNQDRVLFARIHFEAVPQFGDNVRLDYATGSVGPYGLDLVALNLAAHFQGETVNVSQASMPEAALLPVIYDLDDDQRIGLSDFTRFVAEFGEDGSTPSDSGAWFSDFDKGGRVGLGDFSYFVQNFGRNYLSENIAFPNNYPEDWTLTSSTGEEDPPIIEGPEEPEDPPQDPPRPQFQLHEMAGHPSGLALPGTDEIFQLLIGNISFPHGFQIDRLSGSTSHSNEGGEDEELPGDVVLTLVLEDDELYQTEIEVLFDGELVDTLAEYTYLESIITSYVGDVISSLQSMLDDMLSGE